MLKKNYPVFIAFLALAFFAYRDCFDIFIPSDNIPQLYFFEKGVVFRAGESSEATSPYFTGFSIMYLLYQIFGMNPAAWIITSLLMHAACGFLVFLITKNSIRTCTSEGATTTGVFAGLFFLLSPYQTEAVLWQPTDFTVMLASLLFLLGLFLITLYLEDPSPRLLYFLHVPFLLAAFSYESVLVLPVVSGLFFCLYKFGNKTPVSLRQYAIRFFFPQSGVLCLYLLTSKLVFGEWLWHGGAVDLNVPVSQLAGTALKYVAKFFFFFRYLPLQDSQAFLQELFENKFLILGIFALTGSLMIFITTYAFRKKNYKLLIPIGLFFCFLISLIPVLHLDSSFLRYIYPDRYGYLPSAFFYMSVAGTIVFLFRKLSIPALSLYAVLCWILLMQTTPAWRETNEHCKKLIENYRPYLKYDKVYILSLPAYYKGVAAFRTSFRTAVYMKLEKIPLEKIQMVSQYYHESPGDTLRSVVITENSIVVKGPKKRSPFFSTEGGWAQSHETKDFKVDFDPDGCGYRLTFKNEIPAHSAIIHSVNGEWKKLQ